MLEIIVMAVLTMLIIADLILPNSILSNLFKHKRNDNRINIRIDKEGDLLFAFNHDTGKFMAQGNSMEELKDNVERRFPDNTFSILPEK